jgi:hypothetical protein
MNRLSAYRILCGFVGALFVLSGVGFVVSFLRSLASGEPMSGPILLDAGGAYFLAFTGCALVGWGGSLLGVARQPHAHRAVGIATPCALVLMAAYRIAAWFSGDYAFLGNILRVEAGGMLLFAAAFVWLRPPVAGVKRD